LRLVFGCVTHLEQCAVLRLLVPCLIEAHCQLAHINERVLVALLAALALGIVETKLGLLHRLVFLQRALRGVKAFLFFFLNHGRILEQQWLLVAGGRLDLVVEQLSLVEAFQ